MFKRKKQRKTLNKIGIEKYIFSFQDEKLIYFNLCCNKINKKDKIKLEKNKLDFNTYMEWEEHIYNRYKNYNCEQLSQFSRYLNQMIRNTEPAIESWILFISVILTIVLTYLFDNLDKIKLDVSNIPIQAIIFCVIIVMMIVVIPICLFFWNCIKPIWNNIAERNFLIDYKEIIDKMIKDRRKKEKREKEK